MIKSDAQLKTDVEAELAWDPRVNASAIRVTANLATVSLHGTVDTFAAKWAAEDAVMRVSGARSIGQHLSVVVLPQHAQSDEQITEAVHHALKWNVFVPRNITAEVHEGVVTLTGHATWNFQRASASRALQYLAGVVEVINSIALKPEIANGELEDGIEASLCRQWASDGKGIHVSKSGTSVTLTGHASWESAKEARHAAWAIPGVTQVVDQMVIMA